MTESIDGLPWSTFTRLAADHLAEIRARAAREDRLVDPRALREYSARVELAPRRWAQAVLGRPFTGVRSDSYRAFLTLAYALDAEPNPPADPIATEEAARHAAARREREQVLDLGRQKREAAWNRLRAALPVRVDVRYNYSGPLHIGHYHSGADHIVLRDDLTVGRLHRSAGSALCTTPTRSRHQHFDDTGRDEDRQPTCRACLSTAARVVGTPEAAGLADILAATSRRSPR